MKNLRMLMVLVGLVVLVANISAVAQVNAEMGTSFEVKFAVKTPFYVGDKLMDPGDYVFRNGGGVQADTCKVSGKGKNEALVQCRISKIDGITKELEASFSKYGDKLYLDAIKLPTQHDKSTTYLFRMKHTAAEDAAQAASEKK
jgi:hypothetical protein